MAACPPRDQDRPVRRTACGIAKYYNTRYDTTNAVVLRARGDDSQTNLLVFLGLG